MDDLMTAEIADAAPPESFSDLLGEHTGLAIAAGFGLGLLAGAALPGGMGKTAAGRAGALAASVAEIALAVARNRDSDGPDAAADPGHARGSVLSIAGNALRLAVNARG